VGDIMLSLRLASSSEPLAAAPRPRPLLPSSDEPFCEGDHHHQHSQYDHD
jgi:hypothetical protein